MNSTGPLVARLRADVAGQLGDRRAAGRPAEGGVPGAVLGEQRCHLGKAAIIETEAVFGQHFADRVFLFERARHPSPPVWQSRECIL
jgi:hypothetical protein